VRFHSPLTLSSGLTTNAISELSPIDYVLYYKRATAHLSLARHAQALDDFDQVIKLSKGQFDKAYLMKGTVHAREGHWKEARDMVMKYKSKGDKGAQDLVCYSSPRAVRLI
jgi:DnaJ homolog subfamily C member 3